jgi:steroid 5-alpha reductase family enzyme
MPIKDLIIVTLGYAVVISGMYFLYGSFRGLPILTNLLLVDIIGTFLIFFCSLLWRNSSWYDAYWSVIPPILLLLPFIYGADISSMHRFLLLMFGTLFWAIRLTYNWIRNWDGFSHEDWRYIGMKSSQASIVSKLLIDFIGIHLIPTLCVFLGLIPAINALYGNDTAINFVDWIALAIILIGVLIQIISDQQMFNFRKDPLNKGKTMQSGLWFYSRHPNYFGELLFWLGLAVFAIASNDLGLINYVGIIVMYLLIAIGSVKMMDDRSLKSRPDFNSYAKTTPKIMINFFKRRL